MSPELTIASCVASIFVVGLILALASHVFLRSGGHWSGPSRMRLSNALRMPGTPFWPMISCKIGGGHHEIAELDSEILGLRRKQMEAVSSGERVDTTGPLDDSSSMYSTLRGDLRRLSSLSIASDSASGKRSMSTTLRGLNFEPESPRKCETRSSHFENIVPSWSPFRFSISCDQSPVSTTASSIYKGLRRPSFLSGSPRDHSRIHAASVHTISRRIDELELLEHAYQSIVCQRPTGWTRGHECRLSKTIAQLVLPRSQRVTKRELDFKGVDLSRLPSNCTRQGTRMIDMRARTCTCVAACNCKQLFYDALTSEHHVEYGRESSNGCDSNHLAAENFPSNASEDDRRDAESGFSDLILELECRILAAQAKFIIEILNSAS